MIKLYLLLIFCTLSCTRYHICPCEISSKKPDFISVVKNASFFYDLKDINHTVKSILNKKYSPYGIVNPGEQFNPTDIRIKMSNRRLLFGGNNNNITFLVFEEGGVGVQTKCIFIVDYIKIIEVYSIALYPTINIVDFINILKQDKYRVYSCDTFR